MIYKITAKPDKKIKSIVISFDLLVKHVKFEQPVYVHFD